MATRYAGGLPRGRRRFRRGIKRHKPGRGPGPDDRRPACLDPRCNAAVEQIREYDLLFFDTTSTYFEIDEGDEPGAARRPRPAQ